MIRTPSMEVSIRIPRLSGWSYRTWRRFFFVAAMWNILGSLPAIIAPGLNVRLFYGVSTDDFYTLALNRGFWIAVLVVGIGFLIIASDPAKHIGIVWLGIVGKVIVAASWFYGFIIDRATGIAAFVALSDSIFTLFFAYYIRKGTRNPTLP